MNSTDVAMETQDQLKPSEETGHFKVLQLMHFSNSHVKLCDPCFKHSFHSQTLPKSVLQFRSGLLHILAVFLCGINRV